MYSLLCPDSMVDSVFDIDLTNLRSKGIRGMIFDLDNTIIPWDSGEMCPLIQDWLRELMRSGIKVVIVSNNWKKRVRTIADSFGIPFVSRAYKPAKYGFIQASRILELAPWEIAMVGDQMFTDVLGGNRLGFFTIWVKPINSQEYIGTRITRHLEKLAVRILKAKGIMK